MSTDPIKMYPETCPADPVETAEAFVMKRMDPPEASIYQEHLARCQACSKVIEMTRAFVQAMRDASRQLADDDEKTN
jgi:anti-sigma factor RsiW